MFFSNYLSSTPGSTCHPKYTRGFILGWVRYLAHHPLIFRSHRGQKVRNLISILDHSRSSVVLVLKSSEQIWNLTQTRGTRWLACVLPKFGTIRSTHLSNGEKWPIKAAGISLNHQQLSLGLSDHVVCRYSMFPRIVKSTFGRIQHSGAQNCTLRG